MTSSDFNVILNVIGLALQAATLVWLVVAIRQNTRLIEEVKKTEEAHSNKGDT